MQTNPTTAALLWCDDFITGVEEIDEQHRILVHTLKEAGEKLHADGDIANLEPITQDLLSYALYHFETEESLMLSYGYSEESETEAQQHLAQHRAFSAKVVEIRANLKSGIRIAPQELIGFLNTWLANHILNTDKHLAAFICARRAAGK